MKKLFIIFTLLSSTLGLADCFHEGNWFPEGTLMRAGVCYQGDWLKPKSETVLTEEQVVEVLTSNKASENKK